jgi:acyl carrier protein
MTMDLATTEQTLLDVWRDVLGIAELTPDSDFFDEGGHSLTAMKIVSRVRRIFGVELDPGVLFGEPTVRRMSRLLQEHLPTDAN